MANDILFILKARNEARRAAKQFADDLKKSGTSAKDIKDEVQKAKKATDQLGNSAKKSGDGFDRTRKQAQGARREVDLLRAAGVKAGRAIGGAIAGGLALLASGAIFRDAIQTARGFEKALSDVAAVGNFTREQLAAVEAQARDLGSTTVFSAREATAGIEFLVRAGFDAGEALAAIPTALDLALAGGIDLARSADIASNILSAARLEVADFTRVADELATVAASANVNIEQLGASFKFFGPLVGQFGFETAEAAAAIGILGNNGIQGALAGSSLRSVITRLVKPTQQAAAAIEEAGIAIEDLDPASNSLTDILRTLRDANLDASAAVTIFGAEAQGVVNILTSSFDEFEKLTALTKDSEGALKNLAFVMGDNLDGALKGLRSAIEEFYISLVNNDALTRFVQFLTALVRAFTPARNGFEGLSNAARDSEQFLKEVAERAKELQERLDRFAAIAEKVAFALKVLAQALLLKGAIAVLRTGLVALGVQFTTTAATATASGVAMRSALFGALPAIGAVRAALSTMIPVAILLAGLAALEKVRSLSKELRQSVETFKDAGVAAAQAQADVQRIIADGINGDNADAALKAAQARIKALTAQVVEARNVLSSRAVLDVFGDTSKTTQIKQIIADLESDIFATEAVISAIEAAQDRVTGVTEEVRTSVKSLVQSTRVAGETTFTASDGVAELAQAYLDLSPTVREVTALQNEFALQNEAINFQNQIAEISLYADEIGLTTEQSTELNQALLEIKNNGNFQEQADATARLARELITANGGLENMDDSTRILAEQLLDASQNASAAAANTAAIGDGLDSAASKAAELSDAFKAFANAAGGGSSFRLPGAEQLVEQYGTLTGLAREQLLLQQQIAQIEAQRNLSAVVQEAANLTGSLQLSVAQQKEFNALLNEASVNSSFAEAAQDAKTLQDFVVAAAGGVSGLNDETRTLVLGLSEVALENARFAATSGETAQAVTKDLKTIKAALDANQTSAQEVANNLKSIGFEANVEGVKQFQREAKIAVDGVVGPDTIGAIKTALADAGTAVTETVTKAREAKTEIDAVVAEVGAAADTQAEAVTTAVTGVTEAVTAVKTELTDLQTAATPVVEAARQAVTEANTVLKGFATEAQARGVEAVQAFAQGMQSAATAPVQVVQNITQQVVSAFNGLAEQMTVLGQQAIDGFVQGMQNREASAIEQATAVADRVAKAAADALEVQSPSRVFMGIGMDTMDGLGIGIENGAQNAAIRAAEAARLVTDSFQGALSGGDGTALAGGLGGVDPTLGGGAGSGLTAPIGAGNAAGGGGGDLVEAAIQRRIQGYRDEIEQIGLYGEQLDLVRSTQELSNVARAAGTELTRQQIELINQEAAALTEATAAADTFTNGLRAGLDEINNNLQSTVEFTKSLTVNAFNGMSDAIVDFVTTGKADFKGLLTDLLKQVSKFLADRLLANFLNAFGGGIGGGLGGGGGGLFGRAASVGLADGGYVRGQGGPRQDNLLRFLSNGEFVNNARSTSQFGPLLEAINAGRGNDVMGGMYARAYQEGATSAQMNTLMALRGQNTSPAAAPMNVTQNFNFPNGDADSFRRSEGQVRARMQRLMSDADNRNN